MHDIYKHVESYVIHLLTFLSTFFAWVLTELNALGESSILPAVVGIIAVAGSIEKYRRDRVARKLMEKRLRG